MTNPQQTEHSSNLYQRVSRKKSRKTSLLYPLILMFYASGLVLASMFWLILLAAALKYLFT